MCPLNFRDSNIRDKQIIWAESYDGGSAQAMLNLFTFQKYNQLKFLLLSHQAPPLLCDHTIIHKIENCVRRYICSRLVNEFIVSGNSYKINILKNEL